MTEKEVKSAIKKLRAEGMSDEDIMGVWYKMFQDDKITLDQLEVLINILGYQFTEDFKKMSLKDKKTKGYEEVDE